MPHEGKEGEGKLSSDELMNVVKDFCTSREFESEFEMFAKEHAHVFKDAANFSIHSKEHPIEYYDVYKKYLEKFEGIIEDFIRKSGYTINEFYDECKYILKSDTAFGMKKIFIETMLATSEYEFFFMLMQSEMISYRK